MFEKTQRHLLESIDDPLPVWCTSTSVLRNEIPLMSHGLRLSSLIMYGVVLIPGLNLLIPALVFLAFHILYHKWIHPYVKAHSTDLAKPKPSITPISVGLLLLLGINIVFLVDIETTLHGVVNQRPEESQWTFGQTLALLLLSLPIRDVFEFLLEVQALRRREKDTEEFERALEAGDLLKMRKLAKNADVTRFEVRGVCICFMVDGRLMCTSSSFTARSVQGRPFACACSGR
jgi:hypothetical protein